MLRKIAAVEAARTRFPAVSRVGELFSASLTRPLFVARDVFLRRKVCPGLTTIPNGSQRITRETNVIKEIVKSR